MTIDQVSKYQVGDIVGVNEKLGSTRRKGRIREMIWHHKDECYNYYLKELRGKKISKRYFEVELDKMDS